MNEIQKNAAKQAMTEWLAHPQELGKAPAKIECAKEFDLYDMHYYIFKYKRNMLGKWLLGVCGGYEGDSTEHCGHIFSDMKEYNDAAAIDDAKALVEMVRSYWMEQAEKAEQKKEGPGHFVNFVLLKDDKFDKDAILKELKDSWQIEDEPVKSTEGANAEAEDENVREDDGNNADDNAFVINYQGAMISAALMPAPVPYDEAEYHARKNYTWPEGADKVKQHTNHLVVIVFNTGITRIKAGELLVKTVVSCCRHTNVIGIYANQNVYQPELYLDFAGMLDKGGFPLFNLVWFGLYRGKKGACGYTCGMQDLGYDEMEVLESSSAPGQVADFLSNIANYVIMDNVTLKDGETIGFTAEQKLPITKSRGIAIEGDTLKIGFP